MLQWAPLVAPVPAEEGAQLQDFNNPETAELGGECDILSPYQTSAHWSL